MSSNARRDLLRFFGVTAVGLIAFLCGCGGGGGTSSNNNPPPTPTLVSLVESPSGAPLQVGGTQQFTATGKFSDGSSKNVTSSVTWNSSDTVVATIIGNGLVSATALGNSTITASSGSVQGTGAVIVTPTCGTGVGSVSLGATEMHILNVGQFGTQFTPDEHLTYLRQTDGSIRLWMAGATSAGPGQTIGFMTNDFVNLTPITLSGNNAVAGLGPSGPATANFDADYAGPERLYQRQTELIF